MLDLKSRSFSKIQILSTTFNLVRLGEQLDEAMSIFYSAFGSGTKPEKVFDELVLGAFDLNSNPSIIRDLFHQFHSTLEILSRPGDLIAASKLWEVALRPALQWETSRNGHLHKGTAFYFYAVTTILARDFDRGYLFLHKALEDDIRAERIKSPGTPAFRAVVIDPHHETDQFRDWVRIKADLIETALEKYRAKHQRPLIFKQFKEKFLVNEDLRESVFLFSYSIARFISLAVVPSGTLTSDFGRNLCLNLLFDLTLVIDQVIPPRPPDNQWEFSFKALHLSESANPTLGFTQNQLQKIINARFKSPANFGQTLEELLNQTFNYQGCQPQGLSAALAITYGCRNRGAHHVASAGVVAQRFPALFQSLLETLFLAVETFHWKSRGGILAFDKTGTILQPR